MWLWLCGLQDLSGLVLCLGPALQRAAPEDDAAPARAAAAAAEAALFAAPHVHCVDIRPHHHLPG